MSRSRCRMSIRAMNWASDVLAAFDLTQSQRLVLLCLCHCHNGKTGACFPSMETLGKFAGISTRRARMATRDLEGFGLITPMKRTTAGVQQSNQYTLFGNLSKASEGRTPVAGGGRTKKAGWGRTLASGVEGGRQRPTNRKDLSYTPEEEGFQPGIRIIRVISGGRA